MDATNLRFPLWRRVCAALLMAAGVTWLVADILAAVVPSFDCYLGQRTEAASDWSVGAIERCPSQPTPTPVVFPTPAHAEVPSSAAANSVAPPLAFTPLLEIAVVAVDVANVRISPSIASSVIEQVPHGTALQLVGQVQYADQSTGDSHWFEVALPDQRAGWVTAAWVLVGMPTAQPTATPTREQSGVGSVCGMCPMLDGNGNYVWWYYANGGHSSFGTS
ncbi:MAG: SH3 domain-containing protein [Chloroflexi bacterium]|nr:SH3 domain-containing protein [Chloroflexota bacterium]